MIANRLTRIRLATGAVRVLPDFVVIGAQKCGTGSLYRYLTAHPSVAPAARKEVHYFDWGFAVHNERLYRLVGTDFGWAR